MRVHARQSKIKPPLSVGLRSWLFASPTGRGSSLSQVCSGKMDGNHERTITEASR